MKSLDVRLKKKVLLHMDVLVRNNVTIKGRGKEFILFAHGFGCDQNTWRHVSKSFEQDYQVILFDYVGAGRSDLGSYYPSKYGSLEGYADDVLDICDALQIDECIFVGHSVSCMIGVLAAVKQPKRFRKLIFVCPSPYYFNEGNYIGGLEKDDVDNLLNMMNSNYLGWSSMMAPAIMGNSERPELGQELTNSFCTTDPEIARQFAKVTFCSDHRDTLPLLTIQSVTLQTMDDILAPLEIGDYIQRHTRENSLVRLNATGHCPHLSAPSEVITSIQACLRRPLSL